MKLELRDMLQSADRVHDAALSNQQYFRQLGELSLAILDMAECVARGLIHINDNDPAWELACQRCRHASLELPRELQFSRVPCTE